MNSIFRSAMHSNRSARRRALLGLLLLVLLCGRVYAVVIDRIAVIVNADVVTQSEIAAVQQLDLQVSGLPDRDVLQERIDHHLVLQQIAKQPPLTPAPEKIQEIIDSYVKKYGGTEEFLVFLNSIGMNYQDFDKELREQLSIQSFLTLRFRPFVNVSIDEAEQYYNDVYKPELEKQGLKTPAFAFSFEEIQNRIIEQQVKDRTREWLQELRNASTINVKE